MQSGKRTRLEQPTPPALVNPSVVYRANGGATARVELLPRQGIALARRKYAAYPCVTLCI